MFDRKCKIIFVRHGATIYTEHNRLYDAEDYPPLNERGKKEVEKITGYLRQSNPNVDIIYTSSALRTIQSTRIVAKSYKTDFEILDNLFDRRVGLWGGMTFKQIEEKYPEMLEEYHRNPTTFWPEGGEATLNFNKRVEEAINLIVKENFHKRVIVVTHSGIIQAAIASAIGIPPEFQARIYIPTGSATQINYYEEWSSLVYSGYMPL